MGRGLNYTKKEDQILEDYYPTESSKGCHTRLPHRTIISIQSRARKLRIKGKHYPKAKNLIGNIYGIYVALRRGPGYTTPKGRHSTQWWLKCTKCGAERLVATSSLKNGQYTFCPNCPQLEIGEIYNKWIEPIERLEDTNHKSGRHYQQFLVKCHYGAEGCKGTFPTLAASVKNGATTSCGCFNREKSRERCGENNPNWKGGITDLYTQIRNCDKNLEYRTEILERDNYTCQKCGDSKGGNLNVHHFLIYFITLVEKAIALGITDVNDIPDDSEFWDTENGCTLCTNCHKEAHRVFKNGCTKEEFEKWLTILDKLE